MKKKIHANVWTDKYAGGLNTPGGLFIIAFFYSWHEGHVIYAMNRGTASSREGWALGSVGYEHCISDLGWSFNE